ncbi:hypothetical protein FRC08_014959, partial [Ceratobasidium sp. 394]
MSVYLVALAWLLPTLYHLHCNASWGFLDQWLSLEGVGKQRDELGDLFNPKDKLVDTVIQQFFQSFPLRDISSPSAGPDAFSQSIRDTLSSVSSQGTSMLWRCSELTTGAQRIKKLFYNEAAKVSNHEKPEKQSHFNRYINLTVLIKQRCRERILARRRKITSSTDPREQLRAYNQAVQDIHDKLQENEPETIQAYQALVDEICKSATRPFEELSADVQDA